MPEFPDREKSIRTGVFLRYWRTVLVHWGRGVGKALRKHLPLEAALIAAGTVGVGFATWYSQDYERAVETVKAGLIGAGATILLILLFVGLWHAIVTPHRVWAINQAQLDNWSECYRNITDHHTAMVNQADAKHAAIVKGLEGRIAELQEQRPRIEVSLEEVNHGAVGRDAHYDLRVTNHGAPADFLAEITSVSGFSGLYGQTYAVWSNVGRNARILTLASGWLRIAHLSFASGAPKAWWYLYQCGYRNAAVEFTSFQFNPDDATTHEPAPTMTISIYSEPPLVDGPVVVMFRFMGVNVELERASRPDGSVAVS